MYQMGIKALWGFILSVWKAELHTERKGEIHTQRKSKRERDFIRGSLPRWAITAKVGQGDAKSQGLFLGLPQHLGHPLMLFPGTLGLEVKQLELNTGVHMECRCCRQQLNSLCPNAGSKTLFFFSLSGVSIFSHIQCSLYIFKTLKLGVTGMKKATHFLLFMYSKYWGILLYCYWFLICSIAIIQHIPHCFKSFNSIRLWLGLWQS